MGEIIYNGTAMAFKVPYLCDGDLDLVLRQRISVEDLKKGQRIRIGKIEWIEIAQGMEASPAMRIDLTEAQVLMDSLWDCGVRPTEGKGSAGCLAATERHLVDMQRIVFDSQQGKRF